MLLIIALFVIERWLGLYPLSYRIVCNSVDPTLIISASVQSPTLSLSCCCCMFVVAAVVVAIAAVVDIAAVVVDIAAAVVDI